MQRQGATSLTEHMTEQQRPSDVFPLHAFDQPALKT